MGRSKMRWNDNGERSADDGHIGYYSRSADKHEHGVGFIVDSTFPNSVMGSQAVLSKITSIRLKATPLNFTIIQLYAPTSDYSDEETYEFYEQLQNVIKQVVKNGIPIVQGDWNANVGEDATTIWDGICGTSCNPMTNDN